MRRRLLRMICARSHRHAETAWRIWAMLMIAIGAIYLLMFNPYWVPGGDSELYIAVARSWATGLRHTFNGQFVSISPPGWPLLMAAAMKISPTLRITKAHHHRVHDLHDGVLVLVFDSIHPAEDMSALLTLLCAIISHVYSLSFWMHSDAMYSACLRRRQWWWRARSTKASPT